MTQVTSQVQTFEAQVQELVLLRAKYSQLESKVQELDVSNQTQVTSSTSSAGLPGIACAVHTRYWCMGKLCDVVWLECCTTRLDHIGERVKCGMENYDNG